ncbi:hypothetical protein Bbelb_013630 [Branchiostoma belcheri]|nr:hypothetical protein Bbelb_013630 [Branchiostoma belcheri]
MTASNCSTSYWLLAAMHDDNVSLVLDFTVNALGCKTSYFTSFRIETWAKKLSARQVKFENLAVSNPDQSAGLSSINQCRVTPAVSMPGDIIKQGQHPATQRDITR